MRRIPNRRPFEPFDIETLVNSYSSTLKEIDIDKSPVSVFPELTAALSDEMEKQIIELDQLRGIKIPKVGPIGIGERHQARSNVQNFVRSFVNDARLKQHGQTFYAEADASRAKTELRLFLAGGGATSSWYRTAIRKTGGAALDGLSGIRPETVAKPVDYAETDFPRFVIALGLADLPEAMEDAMLPSSIPIKGPLPEREVRIPLYEPK
jgi:Tfp pilus assembly PilM family ATPase